MEKKVFRTNLKCESCILKITPFLNSEKRILSWNVNVQDDKKPLSITFTDLNDQQIRSLVKQSGYEVFEELLPEILVHSSDQNTFLLKIKSYFPLVLILFYLLASVFIIAWNTHNWSGKSLMTHFMGGFFLIFSFFKILNLKAFSEAYQLYDVIAKKFPVYGLIYPFIELFLGISYLTHFKSDFIHSVSFLLMMLGSVGVIQTLRQGKKIQCVCLGTVFNLPMSKITLLENLLMASMALGMMLF